MFIKSYEKLRNYIFENKTIMTLVQLAKGAFFKEATVDICAFVLENSKTGKVGQYIRLEDFKGGMEVQCQKVKEALANPGCDYFYESSQSNFSNIPGSPVAYWVSEQIYRNFSECTKTVNDFSNGEGKNVTTNNAKYILYQWEVNKESIGACDYKWFPCATGGEFRKWYGNIVNVIDWSQKARAFYKQTPAGRIIRREFWSMSGVTWGKISSAASSFRLLAKDEMYQETAILQHNEAQTIGILALLNSCVSKEYLRFLSPTVNFQLQDICAIPVRDEVLRTLRINIICKKCISLSKSDWDSFETSWDFQAHPFILCRKEHAGDEAYGLVENCYQAFKQTCEERFCRLKENEEELNRIFIDIYGLQDELTPEEGGGDVTVARVYDEKKDIPEDMKNNKYVLTKQDVIKSFISYAVGCMFGRYSLDEERLAYAGGDWDSSKYETFIPDKDAIIPITDDEYFVDDIVGRFVEFVRTVYGADMLEENLKFIADALDEKGSTSREVIRNYFLNSFYKDHLKTYQKRPIYWLFDSGKNNGFKCLVYIHRYQPDTIARIRTDYVHEQQARYRTAISGLERQINGASTSERVRLNKQLTKIRDQAEETRLYEEKIHHLADQMISIDLDDGVKHNYAIFQDVLAKIK